MPEQVQLFGTPAAAPADDAPCCGRHVIRPIKRGPAQDFAARVHRHLSPPVGVLYRVALMCGYRVVGVGFAGRPSARMLDDGDTVEITRVAILPGHRDGCSMIYGALRRAGVALGFRRFYTYTLAEEPGTSLRAAGWTSECRAGGGEWGNAKRPRETEQPGVKVRWTWSPS